MSLPTLPGATSSLASLRWTRMLAGIDPVASRSLLMCVCYYCV